MTAKEYLEQAYWLDKRIDSRLEQVRSLRLMATKTTALMRKDVVSHSRNTHSMEDTVAKMADLETEINADLGRLVDLKREIGEVIQKVEDPQLEILLELRYFGYMSWPKVGAKMGLSEATVYRLHQVALGILEKKVKFPEN